MRIFMPLRLKLDLSIVLSLDLWRLRLKCFGLFFSGFVCFLSIEVTVAAFWFALMHFWQQTQMQAIKQKTQRVSTRMAARVCSKRASTSDNFALSAWFFSFSCEIYPFKLQLFSRTSFSWLIEFSCNSSIIVLSFFILFPYISSIFWIFYISVSWSFATYVTKFSRIPLIVVLSFLILSVYTCSIFWICSYSVPFYFAAIYFTWVTDFSWTTLIIVLSFLIRDPYKFSLFYICSI